MIRITLDNDKYMDLELYERIAPITVKNFLKLVEEKYFDGVIFHRIIKDFMVQAGGYYVTDNKIYEKEERQSIKGEFKNNGVINQIKHEKGVISMARTNFPDSASTQFFICTASSPHLDGSYAAFGRIVDDESMKVLDELNKAKTQYLDASLADFPYPVITIKSVRVI